MLRLGLAFAFVFAFIANANAQALGLLEPADPTGADLAQPADPADGSDRIPGLDETSVGIIPAGISAPFALIEGDGIKIAEGTALYPTFGLDTGVVSNVFYEDTSTTPAGVMRLMAGIGTGSLSNARLAPRSGGTRNVGSVQHRAELRLAYDLWLSGNDYVNAQNGLGIEAIARGVFGPQRTWSFLYLENFQRVIRAANFESSVQVNRDVNRLSLGVQFAPQGRSVRGLLSYTNTLDVFEDSDQRFANRLQNSFSLTGAWRFRPYTVLFANVSQGIFIGIGDATTVANAKTDSYPLTATTGIQTLLTLRTTLTGRVGYTNGFYATGPSFSNITGGLEFGYRYSPLGRVTAQYEYRHEDSINANFYRDHLLKLTLDQQFVPFTVSVVPELMFRRYEGIMTLVPSYPDTRDDVIVAVTAALRYYFRNSLAAVLQYRFSTDQTDYMYTIDGDTDDPSFTRHELVLGVRAAL